MDSSGVPLVALGKVVAATLGSSRVLLVAVGTLVLVPLGCSGVPLVSLHTLILAALGMVHITSCVGFKAGVASLSPIFALAMICCFISELLKLFFSWLAVGDAIIPSI